MGPAALHAVGDAGRRQKHQAMPAEGLCDWISLPGAAFGIKRNSELRQLRLSWRWWAQGLSAWSGRRCHQQSSPAALQPPGSPDYGTNSRQRHCSC